MELGVDIEAAIATVLQPPVAFVAGLALLLGLVAGALARQARVQRDGVALAAQAARLEEQHRALERAEQRVRELQQDCRSARDEAASGAARLQERERHYRDQLQLLQQNREQLSREFENLANRIFEHKGKQWGDASRQSLEDTLKPLQQQLDSFQQRVNQVHGEAQRGQSALETEIRKVRELGLQMNDSASNLTQALRGDNKLAGNWGEALLQRTLELAGLQQGQHYRPQAPMRDGEGRQRYPDFVVLMPQDKHLVIDSKLSLADYERAVNAETPEQAQQAIQAHLRAVQRHIDELSDKDYARLPGLASPDFVLAFLPVEAAYIETLRHRPDLFDHAYQRGVVLVSHTTLMPILRTVANLWMVEKGNREAREVADRAGELYNQVSLVAERLLRLGNSLRAVNNHYNDAVRSVAGRQGLHGKVERFRELSAVASRDMPELEPVEQDLERDRLRLVAEGSEAGTADERA